MILFLNVEKISLLTLKIYKGVRLMEEKLSRSLKSRHIMMIAIGGAIGTGLFLGSGESIKSAGPSVILTYAIAGIFIFFMMRSLGEILMSDLTKHSFIEFIEKYLGKNFAFVIGWTYWLCFLSLAMTDLTASGIYIKYWLPNFPQWIPPLIILFILIIINMVNVGAFGELESSLSLIKILAIVALIMIACGLLILHTQLGKITVSLDNLVKYNGFFPQKLTGFFRSFPMVILAYTGIEMVGLTAGETRNPEKDIPKTINSLPLRIGLFYIGSMIALMVVCPWNKISTNSSPFVQVFQSIGISHAASILNIVVIVATISATNSALFSMSRSLYSLSRLDNAPSVFSKLSSKAIPKNALHISSLLLFIIVILNYLIPGKIFAVITSIASINFIFVWIAIICCHYQYKKINKKQNILSFPGYRFIDTLTLIFFVIMIITFLIIKSTRSATILSFIWLIILYIIAHLRKKKGINEFIK